MAVSDKAHAVGGGGIGVILGGEFQMRVIIQNSMKNKTWHHIAGPYEDGSVEIYLDGEILAEIEIPFDFSGINDHDLRIGCAKNKPEYAFEAGFIDEIAIWSRALSEDGIKTVMRSPMFLVSPKNRMATTWGDMKQKAF